MLEINGIPSCLAEVDTLGAYLLGLLYSDGNVYMKGNRALVSFGSDDPELSFFVKSVLGGRSKVFSYKRELGKIRYQVQYSSHSLCNRLVELGCPPRKSFILGPPPIERNLWDPFLLGFFDGDGCISCNRSLNSWKVSIGTASVDLGLWLIEYVREQDIPVSVEYRKIKNGIFYNIEMLGVSGKFFLSKLYRSVESFVLPLSRKYDRFMKLSSVKFHRGPNFQEWEKEILSRGLPLLECVKLLNSDPRNIGWVRSVGSVRKYIDNNKKREKDGLSSNQSEE